MAAENPNQQESVKKQIDPSAKEHFLNGNNLFDESKFNEAIEEFTKAISIDKEYASAYFNRALNYILIKDYDSAKKDINAVMELEPNSPDAPLLMGDIAENNNDLLGARFWYEKALSINPNYVEAKNRLESVDAMLHMDNNEKKGTVQVQEQKKEETVIEEGQIKKVAFYKSTAKFDSVIGLEKIKKYMRDNVVLAIKNPELFKKYGKKLGVGLLLYGPPGVGKTFVINAVAGEAGANVIIAQINQIVDMYTGNTEKNLHAIFEQARGAAPCIIVFQFCL